MARAMTMVGAAVVFAPMGLGKFPPRTIGAQRNSWTGARAALPRDDLKISTPAPLRLVVQDAHKRWLRGSQFWTEKIVNSESGNAGKWWPRVAGLWMEKVVQSDIGKAAMPIVASAAFYLQAARSAFAEVVVVEEGSDTEHFLVFWGTLAVIAFLYFLLIPAIIYNYLRLRWYKRKLAETYFQFMLVFIFFPGMLLLAPFINFRRLPKEGTEPP